MIGKLLCSGVPGICLVIWVLFFPSGRAVAQPRASTASHGLEVEITVVVDNRAHAPGLRSSWGFACVVRGFEKTVLFDTGGDGAILMGNLKSLGIEPTLIDVIVLSHRHKDHIGGLAAFLKVNSNVLVYLLTSFPAQITDTIKASGARMAFADNAAVICPHVHTTGALGSGISEQSLILETQAGLAVITGCGHPGIVKIIEHVKAMFKKDNLLLALGGFHFIELAQWKRASKDLESSAVRYICPLHCTGNRARGALKKMFQERFIDLGAGGRLRIPTDFL